MESLTPRINSGGKFHRIQVFYFWTDESGGLYPGCFRSEGSSATQQCTGFNGFNRWMLREEVKRKKSRVKKSEGRKRIFPTPTLGHSRPLPLFPSGNSKFKTHSRSSVREYKVTGTG